MSSRFIISIDKTNNGNIKQIFQSCEEEIFILDFLFRSCLVNSKELVEFDKSLWTYLFSLFTVTQMKV